MQKILTQAKSIVIFLLLIAIIPSAFVHGFFAYLEHNYGNEPIVFNSVYRDLCNEAATVSFICAYIMARLIRLKMRFKIALIAGSYVVLFFIFQYIYILAI